MTAKQWHSRNLYRGRRGLPSRRMVNEYATGRDRETAAVGVLR
jgi:hypothetical protein